MRPRVVRPRRFTRHYGLWLRTFPTIDKRVDGDALYGWALVVGRALWALPLASDISMFLRFDNGVELRGVMSHQRFCYFFFASNLAASPFIRHDIFQSIEMCSGEAHLYLILGLPADYCVLLLADESLICILQFCVSYTL